MRAEILELINRMWDEKKIEGPVLDVGSAETGYQKAQGYDFRKMFTDRGLVYEATDIREDVGIDFVGDFATLDLGKKYKTILCTEMLEHVDDPVAVVENCRKHLVQGGYILITVPDIYPVHSAKDCWRFTECGTKNLCRKFEPIEFGNFGKEETRNFEHYFIGRKL
jgi:SAM-dependent methyltransferase